MRKLVRINPPSTSFRRGREKQKYAGFGVRFLAWLIDVVVLAIIMVILRWLLIFPPFGRGILKSFGFLVGPLYSILLWVNWNGQTIGKRAVKIKVVGEDGKVIDYQVAIVRCLGYIVSSLVVFLGYFWIIWDEKKQGWHDKIARTYVVEE